MQFVISHWMLMIVGILCLSFVTIFGIHPEWLQGNISQFTYPSNEYAQGSSSSVGYENNTILGYYTPLPSQTYTSSSSSRSSTSSSYTSSYLLQNDMNRSLYRPYSTSQSSSTSSLSSVQNSQSSSSSSENNANSGSVLGIYQPIAASNLKSLTEGELSLTAPLSVSFASIITSNQPQINATIFPSAITVSDSRDANLGFSLTVSASDFVSPRQSIPYANLTIVTENNIMVFSGNQTMSDQISIPLQSSTQTTTNEWSIFPELELIIPAFSPTGVYESTLTFTVS
jgi:hypothetical protein